MRNETPVVNIVMATFNGEKYLEQQIESIRGQVGVITKILVVDDGSTDSTIEILQNYKSYGCIERIIHTERIGPSLAFATGLRHIESASWLSFADQDDIWDSTKLIRAITASIYDEPTLISGARTYINNHGEVIGRSKKLRRKPNWKNALVENICYGNTILLNAKGFQLTKKCQEMNPSIFDAWLYLLFALSGKIVYLKDSGTNYRIHETNTVGIGKTWRLKRVIENQQRLIKNGLLILNSNGSDFNQDFVNAILKYEKCMNGNLLRNHLTPFSLIFFRQRISDSIILRVISPWVYRNFN
jgi:glycosyltransferase involved in cell wall biosynthesis